MEKKREREREREREGALLALCVEKAEDSKHTEVVCQFANNFVPTFCVNADTDKIPIVVVWCIE